MNRRGFLATLAAMCLAPAAGWAAINKPKTFVWWNSKGERIETPLLSKDESRKISRAWLNGTWKPIDSDGGYYLFTPSPWTEEEIEVLRSRGRYIDRWNQDMAIERILPR